MLERVRVCFVAAACLLAFGWSLPAQAFERATVDGETVYRLRLAETWPPDFPIFGDAVENMVAMAERMSAGRLRIEIHARDVHERPLGIFDMVKTGEYDMGHSASYYWKDKDPTTMFFTTVPFGMTAPEQYAWFYYGGGMELMEKVYSRHNMLSFPGGNTGNQMGGWFRKDIAGLEDLEGLRMRIPGFAGEVLAQLGVEPINIPPGDLYDALRSNEIDALEWVGPSHDLRMGFQEVAPYYYTGWHEPATELQFLINLQVWGALPPDLQEILRVAMRTAAYDMYAQSYHENSVYWDSIMNEYPNIIVRTLPQTVIVEMQKANQRLLAEMERQDPVAREIIQSQKAYLDRVRAWTDISDRAYLNSAGQLIRY
jgi:TRAP-type mannitol/chloroaromatic compound transport system substrate-binding protein